MQESLTSSQRRQSCAHSVGGVKQEAAEGVVVAAVVTQEAADWQVDGHLISGLQVHRQDNGGAVLLVLHVLVAGSRYHLAVDQQGGAGGQRVPRRAGVAVDSECQVVDARARRSEDTRGVVVAVAQVDKDMLVDDKHVVPEGAEAL